MISRVSARICVGSAMCAVAFAALTLPASTVASHGDGHSKAHRAKAKKKHRKGQSVKVKCAAVSVSCKGRPGPAGPQGPAGANGAAGLNGANVVLRARSTETVAATQEPSSTRLLECEKEAVHLFCAAPIELSPSKWTQGAGEDDQLMGSATITIPSEAACGAENFEKKPEADQVILLVSVDGLIDGVAEAQGGTTAVTKPNPVTFNLGLLVGGEEGFGPGFLMGSGSAQAHNITAEVQDECLTAVHATVSDLAIDVLGTS